MNGQTTIQINGRPVGLKFAYPAIRWFAEAIDNDKDNILMLGKDMGFTVEGMAKLIQCSYKNYCLIKEVEPSLTYEDFYNYVEQSQETEQGQEELLRISEVYAQATIMKRLVESQKKSPANGVTSH